jgi:hypothetical protein
LIIFTPRKHCYVYAGSVGTRQRSAQRLNDIVAFPALKQCLKVSFINCLIDIFREVLYKDVNITNHLFNTIQFYYNLIKNSFVIAISL